MPTILGGSDLFVDKGSTINLTCTIRFGPEPPGHIFWYHGDKVSVLSEFETKLTQKNIKQKKEYYPSRRAYINIKKPFSHATVANEWQII